MDRQTIFQVIAEFYECEIAIESESALMQAAQSAAGKVGATVVGEIAVRYVPHGLTVAVFLAESHIVLTTWPEHRLLLLDVLLCNPEMSYDTVISEIAAAMCPRGKIVRHEIPRVIGPTP